MDARRLLMLLNIIIETEEKHNLQGSFFQPILDNLGNSQEFNRLKTELENALRNSAINSFVEADLKILRSLHIGKPPHNIDTLFNINSLNEIDRISSLPYSQVTLEMQEFIQSRELGRQRIINLQGSLNSLQLQEVRRDQHQLVISFPEQYRDPDELEKGIHDFKILLKAISKSLGKDEVKIGSVNNGCIEILYNIVNSVIANLFLRFIEYSWKKLKKTKERKDEIEEYNKKIEKCKNNSKEEIIKAYKVIIKEEEEEIKREAKKSEEKMFEELKTEFKVSFEGENKNKVVLFLSKVVKHLQVGVAVMHKIPYLSKPEEITEGDSEEIKKEKQEKLKKYNENLKILQKNKELLAAQEEIKRLPAPEEANASKARSNEEE